MQMSCGGNRGLTYFCLQPLQTRIFPLKNIKINGLVCRRLEGCGVEGTEGCGVVGDSEWTEGCGVVGDSEWTEGCGIEGGSI